MANGKRHKIKKVIFIQAPTDKWYRGEFMKRRSRPPIGLLSLASSIKERGYNVQVVDLLVEQYSRDEFAELLTGQEPDVVGLSVYTECFGTARMITKVIRSVVPGCSVIWGGVFPTFAYEDALTDGGADYVVRFEGEKTMLDLLEALDNPQEAIISKIEGVAYLEAGGVSITRERELIPDLDDLPFPDRSLLRQDSYDQFFSVSTSRGCPAKCTFCSSSAMWGQTFRYRSPENVLLELLELRDKYGMNDFCFSDVTFNANPKRAKYICELITAELSGVLWGCEYRVNTSSAQLLETMWKAGCRKIELGIESGDQEILDSIRKGITVAQAEEVLKNAYEIGYDITCCFILGHPRDTLESMKRTTAMAVKAREDYRCKIMLSYNTPFPGTYQYKNAGKLGLHIHAGDWSEYAISNPIVSTDNFSRDDLRKIYISAFHEDKRDPKPRNINGTAVRRIPGGN